MEEELRKIRAVLKSEEYYSGNTLKKWYNRIRAVLKSEEYYSDDTLKKWYKRISEIIKTKPELTGQAFDVFKEALKSDKNNGDSLRCAYSCLSAIIKARPELAEQACDVLKEALKSDKNDKYSLYNAYDCLSDIVKASPELAEQAFDVFKEALKSDKDKDSLGNVYSCLSAIIKAKPELASQAFDVFKEVLKSDKNNRYSLSAAYNCISAIIKTKPELTEQAFDVFKEALKSDKNDKVSLYHTYSCLSDIVKARPEVAEQAFDLFKEALKSDKNDKDSLKNAYSYLSEIIKARPELAEQAFDVFKETLKSDKNNSESLYNAYSCLYSIIEARPELAEQALGVVKEALKSDKNYGRSLENAYNCLSEIIETRPELAGQAFDVLKEELKSDKNDSYSLYNAYFCLSNIVKASPELAEQAFDVLKEALKSDKNNGYIRGAYFCLSNIVKASPELAEQAFDVLKEELKSDKNDSGSLGGAYYCLSAIIETRPELAEQAFDVLKEELKSDKNGSDSLRHAYSCLSAIIKARPELAGQVFDVFKEVLKSDKNDGNSLGEAYSCLYSIIETRPELAGQAFDLFKEAVKSDKNGYSLRSAYDCLSEIIEARPELAEQAFDVFKEALKSDKNDRDSLKKARRCFLRMSQYLSDEKRRESLNLLFPGEFASLSDEKKQNLDNFLKLKYLKSEEKELLIESFGITKIAEIDIKQYQRAKVAIIKAEIVSQKERGSSTDLSHEQVMEQNKDWLYLHAFAFSQIYGADSEQYMKKIAKYNGDIKKFKALENDETYKSQREAKIASKSKVLEVQIKEAKLEARKNDVREQNIDASDPRYSEMQANYAQANRRVGALSGNLKGIIGYIDYSQCSELSAEKVTAWMVSAVKSGENLSEMRKFVDKHIVERSITGEIFNRFDMPKVEVEFNEETLACRREGQKNEDELSLVLGRYALLKDKVSELSFAELVATAKQLKWAGKNKEFCLSNGEFLSSQQQYQEAEAIYEQGRATPSAFRDKEVVVSKGGSWRCYVASKEDVRPICAGGAFGSKRASCCQSYGKQGSDCAVDSVINPDSGCLIFEKQNKNGDWDMLGCSWFYRSQMGEYKSLCFDNVEINKAAQNDQGNIKAVREVFKGMVKQFEGDNYKQITIGRSPDLHFDESKFKKVENKSPLPHGYSSYSDAKEIQWMLFDNPNATKEQLPEIMVRGFNKKDVSKAQEVCAQCFPEGDRSLSIPEENPQGMVLVDRKGEILGYCLWDDVEKHIYDMAVLPDKNGSRGRGESGKLMAEVVRYVRAKGGKWTAEMKEDTSLFYMEKMAERGLVDLEIGDVVREMRDETKVDDKTKVYKVYNVSFTPIERSEKAKTQEKPLSLQKNNHEKQI